MADQTYQLRAFFLPFMAQGHMIPMIDMTKLFDLRGIRSTVITTPSNASLWEKSIRKSENIELLLMKFPAVVVGLPPGCENLNQAPTLEMQGKIFKATTLLEQQFDDLVSEHHPDFLVADMFFPWASDVAAKYGIPRFVFHGSGFFPLCTSLCLLRHQPHKKVSSDSEPFALPDFPDEIMFTKNQLPNFIKQEVETDFIKLYRAVKESERRSYGVLVNTFYELEPNYADLYRNVFGMRAWHIGPVSLVNRGGEETHVDENGLLNWLNSQRPNSVIYICFGSVAIFDDAHLEEIAVGLEVSGQKFIWVVKREKDGERKENWLPEGFEKRIEGKGVIVRGWAPQVEILNHEAVGGFVTHCGWNSILEAVCAGVSMVTWPISADQFYNEKLVTEVLKVGVPVGVQRYVQLVGDSIKREAIANAVKQIMNGEEAVQMRKRAREFAEKAGIAVELGGSSHNDLTSLIQELKSHTCRS